MTVVKGRLEAGQMGTALRVVDVVAKAKDVLMEFVHILECHLDLNAVRLSLEADRITDRLLILIQLTDKAGDAIRLVKGDLLRRLAAQIGKVNRQKRIQVAVSCNRDFSSVAENRVFSKISGSGRNWIRVPVARVLPMTGRRPFSSSMVGVPRIYRSW